MDAQRAAKKLGIDFYVWDFSERFKLEVVDNFVSEYRAGRTPNPCMRCNEQIKFAALLEKGLALGFDAVCTGHYASILEDAEGNLELHRSLEMAKDQSYVLGVLTQDQLKHSLFPLGSTASKELVRKEAQERGLSVANKPDSYDICFIPEGDTRDWLKDFVPSDPGRIVDQDGNQLGEHDGHVGFTIGQRKGLRIGRPAADGKPRYVLEIRPKTNEVVVGPEASLQISQLAGSRYSWCGKEPANPETPFECEVQVRAHGESMPATAQIADGEMVIDLVEPLYGVAPGQTAVLYVGTRVLGQTTIDRTHSVQVQSV
jgi:tRNA-specific 2-thiouridylase